LQKCIIWPKISQKGKQKWEKLVLKLVYTQGN
jgi:hypothetical protein